MQQPIAGSTRASSGGVCCVCVCMCVCVVCVCVYVCVCVCVCVRVFDTDCAYMLAT